MSAQYENDKILTSSSKCLSTDGLSGITWKEDSWRISCTCETNLKLHLDGKAVIPLFQLLLNPLLTLFSPLLKGNRPKDAFSPFGILHVLYIVLHELFTLQLICCLNYLSSAPSNRFCALRPNSSKITDIRLIRKLQTFV